jgi:hypothetical protein
MDKKEFENKLKKSLDILKKEDKILFDINSSERSISHKLGCYLQKEFEDWNVDCEYNRSIKSDDMIKRVPNYIKNCKKSSISNNPLIYPDIIIHKRDSNTNLAVIEIKKSPNNDEREYDILKIKAILKEFEYTYGVFIDLSLYLDKKYLGFVEIP